MAEQSQESPPLASDNPKRQLLLGLVFGVVFGFLLQKGGVAKYHVLIGVLLLRDFTVIKVMMSAILVGMVGIFMMHRAGLVKLHIKPTRYAANVVGGLLFGVGFALSGYCPGTGAAALGQGNLDALAVMVGMMAGSYLFAEMSAWIGKTLNRIGDRGEVTWPQLLHLPRLPVVGAFVVLIAAALLILSRSRTL